MWYRNVVIACAVPLAAVAFVGCDIEQTDEGEMPNVDVEGGELPEYDVDAADVEVEAEKETIEVPDVDVEMEEKEVTLPEVDVKMPEDDEAETPQSSRQ